jgi:hypothetical protein
MSARLSGRNSTEKKLTPTPVMAGFEEKFPNCTELALQFTSARYGYRLEHSNTDVAVPIIGSKRKG